MTPERLIEVAMAMDWHRANGNWLLAPALGLNTDRSTIRRWKNGSRPIPSDVATWLEDLKATLDRAPKDSVRDDSASDMTVDRLHDIVKNSLAWNSFNLVAVLAYNQEDHNTLWQQVIGQWFKGTRAIPIAVAAWLEDMDTLMERAPNVAGRRQVDITSDGQTVRVDLPKRCIGRFTDHAVAVGPLADTDDAVPYLDEPTTLADWRRFQAALLTHYDIEVGNEWMPTRLKDEGITV